MRNINEEMFNAYAYSIGASHLLSEAEQAKAKAQETLIKAMQTPEGQKAAQALAQQIYNLIQNPPSEDKQLQELIKAKKLDAAVDYLTKKLSQEGAKQATTTPAAPGVKPKNEGLNLDEGFLDRQISNVKGAYQKGKDIVTGKNTAGTSWKDEAVLKRFGALQQALSKELAELKADLDTTSNTDKTVKDAVNATITQITTDYGISSDMSGMQKLRYNAGKIVQLGGLGTVLGIPLVAIAAPVAAAVGLTGVGATMLTAGLAGTAGSMVKDMIAGQKPDPKKAVKVGAVAAIGGTLFKAGMEAGMEYFSSYADGAGNAVGDAISDGPGEAIPPSTGEYIERVAPEATPTSTPEATPTSTPEATPTSAPEATPTSAPEASTDAAQAKGQAAVDAAQTKTQSYSAERPEDLKSHMEELSKEAKSYKATAREYERQSQDYNKTPEDQASSKDLADKFEQKAKVAYKEIFKVQDRIFELDRVETSLADKIELMKSMEDLDSKYEIKSSTDYTELSKDIKDLQTQKEMLLKGTAPEVAPAEVAPAGAAPAEVSSAGGVGEPQAKTDSYSAESTEDLSSHQKELEAKAKEYKAEARRLEQKANGDSNPDRAAKYREMADAKQKQSSDTYREMMKNDTRITELNKIDQLEAENKDLIRDLEKTFPKDKLKTMSDYQETKQQLEELAQKKNALLRGNPAKTNESKTINVRLSNKKSTELITESNSLMSEYIKCLKGGRR